MMRKNRLVLTLVTSVLFNITSSIFPENRQLNIPPIADPIIEMIRKRKANCRRSPDVLNPVALKIPISVRSWMNAFEHTMCTTISENSIEKT